MGGIVCGGGGNTSTIEPSGSKEKSGRKKSWGPQVPVDSALEAALLKAEGRVFKVSSDSLEGRAMRRWSATHQAEYEKEQREKMASPLKKLGKRLSLSFSKKKLRAQ